MIKINSTYLSYNDFYKLFDSIKKGGYIKLSETLGMSIEHHDKYVELSLVALGKTLDANVYFNKMEYVKQWKPKAKPKDKPKAKPQPTVTEKSGTFSGETSLFG